MHKGVYIVNETACLKPGSGAYHHIRAGMNEMSKHFDLQQVNFCPPYNDAPIIQREPVKRRFSRWLYYIKGIYLLLINHRHFYGYYKTIEKLQPNFIYERAGYLNYNGILIAKLLKIPHFYEVNGILWKDYSEYHPGYWNRIAKSLENWSYKRSRFVFFIGGLGSYFNVPASRWIAVQNGIEKEFLEPFVHHEKKLDGPLQLVFIGHAMAHHKLEVLAEATHLVKNPEQYQLHLVGSNIESMRRAFNPAMPVQYHGVLNHDAIGRLLASCHIGIIPYTRDYFSNVKAFMYGAARLCVILPLTGNFKEVFSEETVISMKNGDAMDLAMKLDHLVSDRSTISKKGNAVFDLVYSHYTWEKIFERQVACINRFI